MIDQKDHWDYVGVWTPDGRRFFFTSDSIQCRDNQIHVYDAESKQITHALRPGSLPRWSQDGKTQVWSQPDESLRRFEMVENFR